MPKSRGRSHRSREQRRGDARREKRGRRSSQRGRLTGRHKVPFVSIKTSSTEYLRTFRIKGKKAKRKNRETGSAGLRDRGGTEDGTTKHRAAIQLRANRSFQGSRLPTKFAIYDPGKPKRTSFHDVAGRYPHVTIRSNLRKSEL